jgi:ribosome-associated protein
MLPGVEDVAISTELITLGQLLKLSGALETGGDARAALAGGGFTVNGEPDDRRGRKLYPGDTVGLPSGQQLRVVAESA